MQVIYSIPKKFLESARKDVFRRHSVALSNRQNHGLSESQEGLFTINHQTNTDNLKVRSDLGNFLYNTVGTGFRTIVEKSISPEDETDLLRDWLIDNLKILTDRSSANNQIIRAMRRMVDNHANDTSKSIVATIKDNNKIDEAITDATREEILLAAIQYFQEQSLTDVNKAIAITHKILAKIEANEGIST